MQLYGVKTLVAVKKKLLWGKKHRELGKMVFLGLLCCCEGFGKVLETFGVFRGRFGVRS
jgi:hypothetical protein